MRFRLGRPADFAECLCLLRVDGGWQPKDSVWDDLPNIWKQIFSEWGRATFVVYETDDDEPVLAGFGMSAFVVEAFRREEIERPRPYVAERFYERYEDVLLTPEAVRRANTEGRLDLLILHSCHRHPDLAHPETRRMLPVAAQSFHFLHAGHRLRWLWGEAYGAAMAEFLRHGGYTLISDFPDHADRLRRPYALGLDRDRVERGGSELAMHLVHPEPPIFHFTPAEQRLLTFALMAFTDRQVAAELAVSIETVRSTWDAIYTRVGRARPRLLREADSPAATRSLEKKRQLLDYVRQHLEELRPFVRP
jgi:hypothetical protein